MRVLALALAILLLPLRGWMGDAMALGMVQQHARQGQHQTVAAPHDHASHAQGSDAHESHAATPAANDCQNTCGNCQLCHSVAMPLMPVSPSLTEPPRQPPAFRPAVFASAEPSVGLKPPIS